MIYKKRALELTRIRLHEERQKDEENDPSYVFVESVSPEEEYEYVPPPEKKKVEKKEKKRKKKELKENKYKMRLRPMRKLGVYYVEKFPKTICTIPFKYKILLRTDRKVDNIKVLLDKSTTRGTKLELEAIRNERPSRSSTKYKVVKNGLDTKNSFTNSKVILENGEIVFEHEWVVQVISKDSPKRSKRSFFRLIAELYMGKMVRINHSSPFLLYVRKTVEEEEFWRNHSKKKKGKGKKKDDVNSYVTPEKKKRKRKNSTSRKRRKMY